MKLCSCCQLSQPYPPHRNQTKDSPFSELAYPCVFATVEDSDAFGPNGSRVINDVENRLQLKHCVLCVYVEEVGDGTKVVTPEQYD